MTLKALIRLSKATITEWQSDRASSKAAALAYYTTFSMAPLLVVILALTGLIGGREATQGFVMSQVQDLIGMEGRAFVESMIQNAAVAENAGIWASIIGGVTLLIGALGVFNELQKALNRIWEVETKPITHWSQRVRDFIVMRLLSFTMLLGIGFLLLVSLIVNAGLSALNEWLKGTSMISEIVLQGLNFVVSIGIITLLFAMIFKFIPDAKITWKNVGLGALITALLFSIGKTLIGLYLGASRIGTTFGAAGSLALMLIWIYYSSQIVFLGAEFTQVYTRWTSGKAGPTEHANGIEVKTRVTKRGRK